MSPIERLRWAMEPDHHRSTLLLWGGLAAFVASGGISTVIEVPRVVSGLLYLAMIAGWVICACGVVGYVRWFFGQTAAEARKLQSLRDKE